MRNDKSGLTTEAEYLSFIIHHSSFFTDHYGANHGGQEQDTGYFKRYYKIGEKHFAQVLHQTNLVVAGSRCGYLCASFKGAYQGDQQESGGDAGAQFPGGGFLRLGILGEVEQHQHKQEQYHDGAGVHDDVYNGEELRIEQHILPGDGKKCEDEVQHAVYRVFRKNHEH